MLVSVADSKHIMHLHSYHDNDDMLTHLEIEACVGSVNVRAFSFPNKQLCDVTCGVGRSH